MSTNRIRRRAGALVAGVVLLAGSAAACSGGPAEDTDEVGGTAELTVFAPQGPDQKLESNLFTKKLEKKFDIEFTFQTTTWDAGPAAEKRQITLASGDYPDLFLLIPWVDQFQPDELMKLGRQGVAIPLNDLIAEHAPHIQQALDSNPEYRAMATAPDGKIYGLPQWVDCYHCSYSGKLWMNSKWLDELGLEQPTTTEEMREVLRAFKTQDPNGNGKADEVPVSASVGADLLPYFMNAFVYDPQGGEAPYASLVLNDGRVDINADTDGWREGLRYLKSLYQEGLIDKGAFTQNNEALHQLGDHAGDPILGAATVLHPGVFVTIGQEDGRDRNYDPVPPLTGPSGANYAGYSFPSQPGATFVLTNKASENDQVAAIKMLDHIFTTQGEIEGLFGEEGVDWEQPKPNAKPLDPEAEPLYRKLDAPGEEPRNSAWQALAQYNNTRAFRDGEVVPDDIYDLAGYERRLFEATKLYEGHEDPDQIYPFWRVWVEPDQAGEVAQLRTNVENYINQNSLQFITGAKDIDTEWDDYVAGFEGIGLPRYLELLQAAYETSETTG